MRIQGELLKLGISVSATTVATVLRVSDLGPAPRRISPSWSEFLRAQAQSMLGVGLPSQPGCGLEGNISAVTAPTPEAAACGAPAGKLASTVTEERWFSSPVRAPPRLSAVVAAVPSPGDRPAAPTRPSQQWHPRDGPKNTPALCAPREPFGRCVEAVCCSLPSVRAAATRPRPPAARLFTRAAAAQPGDNAPSPHLNRVSLPHRARGGSL
jgi:hypothetical protein